MKKLLISLVLVLVALLLLLGGLLFREKALRSAVSPLPVTETTDSTATAEEASTAPGSEPTEAAAEFSEQAEPDMEETLPVFTAAKTPASDPANWNTEWKIIRGDAVIPTYYREDPIFFQEDRYFALPGVAGFRGGSDRANGAWGTAEISKGTITELWKMNVGYLESPDWIGCGWTGQPLVAQWTPSTRAVMNLYPEKKEKDGLVEAIYAKMDGYIHFVDMEDGSYTRDPLYVGWVFKGSGALDPRGYPILYLGAGLTRGAQVQSIMVISLIDGSILYELPGSHELAPRYWYAFDSNPLIDAETDTLIWAGECGLIYTIRLNTQYNETKGILTMAPEAPVMSAYKTDYSRGIRFSGYEASIAAAENYLYLGDNSGMLQCVDVNTMKLIWEQDLSDDINATPALEREGPDNASLYAAPSVDYNGGDIALCKLDALSGEILWQYDMECCTDTEAPGGLLASPLLGKAGTNMENTVIFSVGRTPDPWSGRVIAFHKHTGEILWEYETDGYIWSSPIALYNQDGKGYLFQADASGTCLLMDGNTGKVLDTLSLKRTIESSPVAFDNKILLGTRSSIHLLEIN